MELFHICCNMRTGSHVLCNMLYQASIGDASEYLAPNPVEPTIEQLVQKIEEKQTGDYIGTKILYGQLVPYAEQSGIENFSVIESINEFLRPAKVYYIHLYRRDKVEQAASALRAEQLGQWHVQGHETVDESVVKYDRRRMTELIDMFEDFDSSWRRDFKHRNIEPLSMAYEDMAVDICKAFRYVVDFMNIRNIETPAPAYKKIARTEHLVRQYRADIASSAAD